MSLNQSDQYLTDDAKSTMRPTLILLVVLVIAIAIGTQFIDKPRNGSPTTEAAKPKIATDPNLPELKGGMLPGFPEVPAYPDADLVGSAYTELPKEANKGFRAKWHTHDSVGEIIAWYMDELPQSGWTVGAPEDFGAETEQIITIKKGPWVGFVAAEVEGDENEIVIDVKQETL
jgi:hypothetical protein